jgi:hypothetical protein
LQELIDADRERTEGLAHRAWTNGLERCQKLASRTVNNPLHNQIVWDLVKIYIEEYNCDSRVSSLSPLPELVSSANSQIQFHGDIDLIHREPILTPMTKPAQFSLRRTPKWLGIAVGFHSGTMRNSASSGG